MTEKGFWRGILSDDFASADICLFGIAADELVEPDKERKLRAKKSEENDK